MTKIKKPSIESGASQKEEMLAIGLDPSSALDRQFFKVAYNIWAEEKAKLIHSTFENEASFNEAISKRVQLRLAELQHGQSIN